MCLFIVLALVIALVVFIAFYVFHHRSKQPQKYTHSVEFQPNTRAQNDTVFYTLETLKALYSLINMSDTCAVQLPVTAEIVDKLNTELSARNAVPFDLSVPISSAHYPNEAQFKTLLASVNILADIFQQGNFTLPDCWVRDNKFLQPCPLFDNYCKINAGGVLVTKIRNIATTSAMPVPNCVGQAFCEVTKCMHHLSPNYNCEANYDCDWNP